MPADTATGIFRHAREAAVRVCAMTDVDAMSRTVQRGIGSAGSAGSVSGQFRDLRNRRIPIMDIRNSYFKCDEAESDHEDKGDAVSDHERKVKGTRCALTPGAVIVRMNILSYKPYAQVTQCQPLQPLET